MTYNDEEIKAIEEFSTLNYSPTQIAIIMQFNVDEFLQDWSDMSNNVRKSFEKGRMLANAAARKNIVNSASSSITAAQEYKKMIEADKIEEIKNQLDASVEPPKSENALIPNYKDSIDDYYKLQEFIFDNKNEKAFPSDLQEYWNRLNTAHDLQTKFANRAKGKKYIVNLLRRKYTDISESTAYRYIYESLNFFAVNLDKNQWRNILSEDLEKAKALAWAMNRVDWFIKAVKEQAEIQQVKLPEPEKIDPELLKEKILLIVNDPGVLSDDLKKIDPNQLISKIKTFDIEMADKIKIAKDAGIEDVDFEEIFGDETEIPQ